MQNKYKVGDRVKLLGLFPDGSVEVEVFELYNGQKLSGEKGEHLIKPVFIGKKYTECGQWQIFHVYDYDIKYNPAMHILHWSK